MNPILYISIGFISCALLWAFHGDIDAQADDVKQCPKPFKIEWHVDYSSVDDIGLKRLSLKDIEEQTR